MFFSVIIPTFKRRETLSQCLKHLAPKVQTISPELYEVIVTDDALAGSPDESLMAEFPWVRHLPGPQKGPASNRNNGARAAQGEWLIFLDDDCLPQTDFLLGYYEAIQQHPGYRLRRLPKSRRLHSSHRVQRHGRQPNLQRTVGNTVVLIHAPRTLHGNLHLDRNTARYHAPSRRHSPDSGLQLLQ